MALTTSLFSTLVVPTSTGRPSLWMRAISVTTAFHLYCSSLRVCVCVCVCVCAVIDVCCVCLHVRMQPARARASRRRPSCPPPKSARLNTTSGLSLRDTSRLVGTTATGSL